MERRTFINGLGGLVATAALPGCLSREPDIFAKRGSTSRISVSYAHVRIGLKRPFSVLHLSDTHLTAAYDDEAVAVSGKAAARTECFGGRQEDALASSLEWAKKNVDYVIHTGDLVDFQSRANFDLVRKYYGPGVFGPMGNHEFYTYRPDERITLEESFKDGSWTVLEKAYPVNPRFHSQVVNDVNFVCLDNTFGRVAAEQAELFRRETEKGLPIVLCAHVPFFTEELWHMRTRYWRMQDRKYHSAELPSPSDACNDYKRQTQDATTRAFVEALKRERLLRAILVGHEHVTMEDDFSPTAREYAVGGNFLYNGREILFS